MASMGVVNWWLLLAVLMGISLVIASACVFNNYIDRDIDKLMARTKKRSFAAGNILVGVALTYGAILGITGILVLVLFVNLLTACIGLVSFVFYVVVYGYAKRKSVHGTLVGSISGAAPPVAGYVAVTNHFDMAAFLLFMILTCWQMPHFYAIAMYRYGDYKKAGLPVLPVKKSMRSAELQIMVYIVAFAAAASLLTVWGYTGYIYLVSMLVLSIAWFFIGTRSTKQDAKWARKMFLFSLVVLMSFSVIISIDSFLP